MYVRIKIKKKEEIMREKGCPLADIPYLIRSNSEKDITFLLDTLYKKKGSIPNLILYRGRELDKSFFIFESVKENFLEVENGLTKSFL